MSEPKVIIGIDEVGRGCLAGPLVVGAVILAKPITGLKDSKLLTKLQRERLDRVIRSEAFALGLGWTSPGEIDELGLTGAESLAIERALAEINCDYEEIIIDGSYNFLADNPKCRAMIKADQLVPAVSAASIIAKVARDNYMASLAAKYQHYGFDKHVGYGTKAHLLALAKYGASDIHRKSFAPVKLLQGQLL